MIQLHRFAAEVRRFPDIDGPRRTAEHKSTVRRVSELPQISQPRHDEITAGMPAVGQGQIEPGGCRRAWSGASRSVLCKPRTIALPV